MQRLGVTLTVEKLPWNYTCDGEDISPEIGISGVEAPRLALIMLDANSPGGGGFVHWLMWNIESVSIVPENIPKEPIVTFPVSAVQGTNGFGRIGYAGPCPPPGENHRYDIKLYGLDRELDLPPGSRREALFAAMNGHVIQFGETHVRYGR
ncbi:MAG: YbhB/YbcL family Raf kinase inhibitor-like protein [Methanomicrobiales archaeon]|nr:YbhB/YbcL family Raf kinase inhibitor-like protein [Methanomicrobiales archaeon]